MKKQISKLFSLLLAVIMVIGLLPTTAFAEEVDVSKLPTPDFYLTINNMPKDTDLSLNTFQAGDKIEYRFSVYNPSEYIIVPTEVKLSWGDEEETDNNDPGVWTNPEKTIHYPFLFKHVVTEEEAKAGCVFTEATMEYSYYIDDELVPGPTVTASHIMPVGEYAGLGGVHVKKVVTNKPANGICFMEGDTVNFTTYVVNYANHPVNGLKVTEDRNGSKQVEYTAPSDYSLAPGQVKAINSSYVVSHIDSLLRSLYSYSTVTWNGNEDAFIDLDTSITSNVVQVPVGAKDGSEAEDDAFVSIVISPETPPANGIYYELGEKIELKFEIVNQSFQHSAKDLAVETTGMDWSIGNDTKELLGTQSLWSSTYASHTVDWHDILMGGVKVQAYVDAWDAETDEYCGSFSNVLALPVYGSISDWPDWKDQNIGLTQKLETTPANGKYFEAGETIEITVTTHEQIYGRFEMFKNYNYSTLHTAKGSELVYLKDLALVLADGKDERSQTFSYKVTPEDAKKGWICSEIYGWAEYDVVSRMYTELGRPEYDTEYDKFYYIGEPLVVPCGHAEVTGEMSVELEQVFGPNNGSKFVPGEYVTLQYTVNNNFSAPLTNPSAKLSADNGGEGREINLSDDLPNVMQSRERNLISYKVTAEDAQKGSITFTYSIDGATRDGKSHSADSNPVTVLCGMPTDPALGIYMTETSTPANGEYYELGDTITYNVTIVNNSSTDLGKCDVTDFHNPIGSVEQLGIGEEKSFEYSTVVTQDFVDTGLALAMVEVHTTYDEEQISSDCYAISRTGAEELPIWSITKSVTSTPANGEYYTKDEIITYKIVVQKGEETMGKAWTDYEFRVIDELTGDMTLCNFEGKDSFEMTADYVVTGADVTAGSVTNVATLQWRDNVNRNWGSSMNSNAATVLTGEETSVDPGEDEEPQSAEYAIEVTKIIEGENAPTDTRFTFWLEVGAKTYGMFITGAGKKAFTPLYFTQAGTYTYTVSEGNGGKKGWTYDESEIEVSIEIIEVETESGEPALEVGTVTFTKDGDRVDGVSFTNTYDDSGEQPGTDPVASATVVKAETSTPKNGEFYVEGEKITYSITVTNTGDVTFDGGYEVYDILANPQKIGDGSHINCLAECVEGDAGNTRVFTFEYTVTAADAAAGSVSNYAWLTYNVYENGDLKDAGTARSNTVVSKTGVNDPVDPGEDEKYDIAVISGKATVGAGTIVTESEAGVTITITADAPASGKVFDKWVIKSDTQPVLAKATDATTTFTMPEGAVTVEATYKNAPVTPGDDPTQPGDDPTDPGEQNPETGAPVDPAPQTGDNSRMFLWIALLFVSGAGVAAATILGKKKRYNR